MSGVSIDIHHNPTGPEGRPHMLVLSEGWVWHLTEEELRELSAKALMALARENNQLAAEADRIAADDQRRAEEFEALVASNDDLPIDGAIPFTEHAAEMDEAWAAGRGF